MPSPSPSPRVLAYADFTPILTEPSLSPISVEHSLRPILSPSIDSVMKDISTSSYRSSRNVAYPKKRPSPSGISKAHKTPALGHLPAGRKFPYSAKATLLQQRQRDAQIAALRRQGVLLEEEYREDIRFYMHEMEVSVMQKDIEFTRLISAMSVNRDILCPPHNPWTNNPKSGGICALV